MRAFGTSAALVVIALALTACGGDETVPSAPAPPTTASSPAPPEPPRESTPEPRPQQEGDKPEDPEPKADPRDDEDAKQAALELAQRAYRTYIDAINERDGKGLCALLPPGAERTLKPAAGQGGCAERLEASIGYEDPRGFPVWKETTLSGIESASIGRDLVSARLTGAIVTSFADRTEPSIESDIAYLEVADGRWRLAKPTGALYRAIGQPEIPPTVISPP